jgi:hypothetical protein
MNRSVPKSEDLRGQGDQVDMGKLYLIRTAMKYHATAAGPAPREEDTADMTCDHRRRFFATRTMLALSTACT